MDQVQVSQRYFFVNPFYKHHSNGSLYFAVYCVFFELQTDGTFSKNYFVRIDRYINSKSIECNVHKNSLMNIPFTLMIILKLFDCFPFERVLQLSIRANNIAESYTACSIGYWSNLSCGHENQFHFKQQRVCMSYDFDSRFFSTFFFKKEKHIKNSTRTNGK